MAICWEYAIAIVLEGTLNIVSDWKLNKVSVQLEYRAMGTNRGEYKAFIMRRAVKGMPDGTWWVFLPDLYELEESRQ